MQVETGHVFTEHFIFTIINTARCQQQYSLLAKSIKSET